MGTKSFAHPRELKKLGLVILICVILISSVIIVDMASAGYEHNISEPSFSHDFPKTILFHNISEGITSNMFSLILDFAVNHSGHHHIIPREISLLFWFKADTARTDLSKFIDAVLYYRRNGTFDISHHNYDQMDMTESGWWAPSLLHFVFNDRPDIDFVRFGLELKIILVNFFGDNFVGHELNVQLEMNVTYSRWWYSLPVSESHQTEFYHYNLTQDCLVEIQTL